MDLFFCALLILACGGVLAWVCSTKLAALIGLISCVIGCCMGMIAGGMAIFAKQPLQAVFTWTLPYNNSIVYKIDPLSGFFLVFILGICGIAAVYGRGYWQKYAHEYNLGMAWFFFNTLVLSLAVVVTSANGLLFLVAWEIMSLSSFFLVTFENEKPSVRNAGITYLIATHIGTAFLFVMFWILGHNAFSNMDFAKFQELQLAPEISAAVFICAVIGFGTKAGLMPFHVWLPEAHPAAPSHVSAVMSGVMIKTGIYGILRILTFLTPELWWGILLIILGVISGVFGVILAFVQKEIKRFLAYHSVENIGIICIGIGLGIIGIVLYQTNTEKDVVRHAEQLKQAIGLIVLGFGGAIFHILNHAIFKSMMFLCAGAVIQQTETGNLNTLGGLLKKMPITGFAFLIGSIALSGLPPLNGFISEFFIYLASFYQIINIHHNPGFAEISSIPLIVILGLVLMGGMAMGYYIFSMIFLGSARTEQSQFAKDPGRSMTTAILTLSGLCVVAVLVIACFGSQILLPIMQTIVPQKIIQAEKTVPIENTMASIIQQNCDLVGQIVLVFAIFLGILIFLVILRRLILRDHTITQSVTWDCGYLDPTARIQYTGSSFVQPLADLFASLIHYRKNMNPLTQYFNPNISFSSHTHDFFMQQIYERLFGRIGWIFGKLDWMQHGRLHLYLLYIGATLVLLLVWFILFVR